MIKTLAELKRVAQQYTWELYHFNKEGTPMKPSISHKFMNKIRKVKKVQSNGLWFEGGSYLDYPKASQVEFHPYTPGGSLRENDDTILKITLEDGYIMGYHLRPIKEEQ